MTPAEALGRADQAKAELALTSEAFQAIRDTCLARMLVLSRKSPIEADALHMLAVTINVADDVEAILKGYVADGKVAEDSMARLRKVEQMSPERRRYADAL